MSDHIPQDVMTNIFQRLSFNDLLRCRSVSKQWLATVEDPHFISWQLQHSITTNSIAALFLQDNWGPLLYWKEGKNLHSKSKRRFFKSPSPNQYMPGGVQLMGSCHGLVCFFRINDLVVLNPSTGEQHTVSNFIMEWKPGMVAAYGFGYDEISNDYKAVMIMKSDSGSYRAEIYSVRAKSFSKTIPLPIRIAENSDDIVGGSESHSFTDCNRMGLFVGGSLHWFTLEMNSACYAVHAIDIGMNTYSQIPMPENNSMRLLDIAVMDSCFCVCTFDPGSSNINIWMMMEYGNFESWKWIHRIKYGGWYGPSNFALIDGRKRGHMLLMLDRHRFAWCKPGRIGLRTLLVGGLMVKDRISEACYCLETLVKIFPVDYDKRDDYDEQVMQKVHDLKLTD